jgi:excisionase family DNA binding protein
MVEVELLSAREAAVLLGCSEAGVRRWVARGRLRGIRVGRALRIAKSDLDAIVARGTLDVPTGASDASQSIASPLPWTVRRAQHFLDELGGDIAMARRALDLAEACRLEETRR